jgi:hypothetical protein
MRPFHRMIFVALGALLLSGTAALAQDPENPFERGSKDLFSISVGGFLMKFNSSAELDPESGGDGSDIDIENQLDLDDKANRARIDGYWRFARKHRIDFGGYLFNRSNTRELDERIEFGDTTYDVGARVETRFNTGLYKLSYRYSFVRNERIDFSASAGISAIVSRLRIEGEGSVNGSSESFERTSKNIVAPIPVFGAQMDLKIVKSLFFRLSGEYFHITVSGIEGRFSDGRASIDWYPFKHFGFGAGYNRVGIRAEDSDGANYNLEYRFDGLLGYATYVY